KYRPPNPQTCGRSRGGVGQSLSRIERSGARGTAHPRATRHSEAIRGRTGTTTLRYAPGKRIDAIPTCVRRTHEGIASIRFPGAYRRVVVPVRPRIASLCRVARGCAVPRAPDRSIRERDWPTPPRDLPHV